ncbi:MAG: winged helix-turn-helix domain-containing protein [Candidatus Paceibacterota bacterium]
MKYLILIIVGILGVWVGSYLGRQRNIRKAGSLERIHEARQKNKEEAKLKIMNIIERNGRITNDEVEKLVDVSDATATRYLDELEQEGKVSQKGEGRGVYYTKT